MDTDLLKEMSEEVQKQLLDLTGEIYALAGEGFNINSSRQLGHILFDKLKLPVIKKTKPGIVQMLRFWKNCLFITRSPKSFGIQAACQVEIHIYRWPNKYGQ